jgi:hypothetical protein
MKKAISLIAIAAFLLLAGKTQAQGLGINIGFAPQSTTNFTPQEMNGFFAGVNYNHALSNNIGLSFGGQVRYNMKKSTTTVLSASETTTYTQILVDVPVLFNFAIPFGNDVRLAIFAGPVLSYALKGNTNISENLLNTSTDFNWYGEKSNYNQFDLLGAVGVSLRYQTFRLFGGYRMGLLDINKSDKVKSTTSGIFVGLGFVL